MSEIIAPSAAELEAFKAAAERIGQTAREIERNMVESFEAVGRAPLSAAYPWHGKPPVWLPLTRRTDPTIGRKRRARRARGRRIENRRPYSSAALAMACIWLASARSGFRSHPLPRVMMLDEVDSFPTGELTVEQWAAARQTMQRQKAEEQADG
jgi:hypothetical protein